MPSMANITVKNAANVDTTYNAAVPSAGDRSPARWNINAASTVAGFRPTITVATRDNGSSSQRIMEINAAVPITQVVSGVTTKVAQLTGKASFVLPRNVDSADVLNGYVLTVNAMASALFKQIADEGYAPT